MEQIRLKKLFPDEIPKDPGYCSFDRKDFIAKANSLNAVPEVKDFIL